MTILDTFFILFDSDSSKLDKGLGETEKKTDKLTGKLGEADKAGAKLGEGLYSVLGKAAGLLGVGLSIGALVAGIKSTATAYDELGKLAARFRSTTEAVDDFRDAASLLGISEETSTAGLKGLDTAIQDTYLGLGRAKAVFEELGIRVTDTHGKIKPTTQVMEELAGKMAKLEKGTQIRVMERLGLDPALLKLFNADLVALQKRMGDVDRAAGFNLDDAVKRSKEYTKAQKDLSLETKVLQLYLSKMVESFQVAALPYFTKALETATKYVRQFSDFVMTHRHLVEGAFIALGAAILYFLVPAAISGAVAIWAMLAPFLLIGAVIAAVGVAFALLYDDVMNFVDGNDSLIGQIASKYPMLAEIVKSIGVAYAEVWEIVKAVAGFLVDVWNDPAAAFAAFGDGIMNGMKAVGDFVLGIWQMIVDKVLGAINSIKEGAQKVASFVGLGGSETSAAVAAGQAALAGAGTSSMGSQTSNSISTRASSKSTSVQIGKVEVQTQATDAAGISKAIGGTMTSQMRQAVANYDDGVIA